MNLRAFLLASFLLCLYTACGRSLPLLPCTEGDIGENIKAEISKQEKSVISHIKSLLSGDSPGRFPITSPCISESPSTSPSTSVTPSSSATPSPSVTTSSSPSASTSVSPTPSQAKPRPLSSPIYETNFISDVFDLPTDGSDLETFALIKDRQESGAVLGESVILDDFRVDGDFGDLDTSSRWFLGSASRQSTITAIHLWVNGQFILVRGTVSCRGSLGPLDPAPEVVTELVYTGNSRNRLGIDVVGRIIGDYGNGCTPRIRFRIKILRGPQASQLITPTPSTSSGTSAAPSISSDASPSVSSTPSLTPSNSHDSSSSPNPSASVSEYPSVSSISSDSSSSPTPSALESESPSISPSMTSSPITTPTSSLTPSPIPYISESTPASPSVTISATSSISGTYASTPTPTPSITESISPLPSVTASVTRSTAASISPTTSTTPSISESSPASPSVTASMTASIAPTTSLTATPSASAMPSATPSPMLCTNCRLYSQYCDNSGVCQDVLYDEVVAAPGYTISEPYSAFNVAMISDIQFYYTNCKEQENLCIYDDNDNGPQKTAKLMLAAARQAQCVTTLTEQGTYSLIIDGGDLTNTGAADELLEYSNFLSSLPNLPTALVLGNHDYYLPGNIPGPVEAARMITFIETHLGNFGNTARVALLSADFGLKTVDIPGGLTTKYVTGSFMYSIEVEGIIFIIMHWAPSLRQRRYIDEFSVTKDCPSASCETESGHPEYYDITDGYDWLTGQLNAAEAAGKKVVLCPHFIDGLVKYFSAGNLSDLRELVEKNVIAVLTGHDHDQWGYYGVHTVTTTDSVLWQDDLTTPPSGIPVYYGGSASYEKLLSVTFQNNGGNPTTIIDQVYTSEEGTFHCTGVARDNLDA